MPSYRDIAEGMAAWLRTDQLELLMPLRVPERRCAAKLVALAELETGTRLLDIGCGSGHLLALAAATEPGAVLVGVDPDVDAIEVARRKLRRVHARTLTLRSGAESLPLADAFFDVVTCCFVLQRLPEALRRLALRECFRVLRPGGRILVADWRPSDTLLPSVLRPWLASLYGLGGGRLRVAAQDLVQTVGFECVEPARAVPTWTGIVEILCGVRPQF